MTIDYTDRSLIEAFIKRELTDNEQLTLVVLIPAIRKWIDAKTDMTFLSVAATDRIYDGGSGCIDIDPCTSVTAVITLQDDGTDGDTYIETTDYVVEPVNETIKTEIRKRYGTWPVGTSRMQVTAKFSGWDNGVPQDIQTVATILAANILSIGQTGTDNIDSESLEGHSITYGNAESLIDATADKNPLIKQILEQHRQLVVG